MRFRVYPLEFTFRARKIIRFPAMASNTFRGALGLLLREVCGEAEYRRIFEPKAAAGPSGLADSPRPFVIRAEALNGQVVAKGEEFTIRIPAFTAIDESLERAFAVWDRAELLSISGRTPFSLEVADSQALPGRIVLEFITPTELKSGGELVTEPEFPVVAARLCERITTLSALYGEGSAPLDFHRLADAAASVRMMSREIRHVPTTRKSTRSGQTHPLGGFVGTASYVGDLTPFLPLLKIGEWTGVGRQTAWGKGALRIKDFLVSS